MFIPLLAFLGAVVVCIYLSVVWDAEASKLKSCGNLTKTATADYILNYIRVFFSRGDSRVLPTSASTSSEVDLAVLVARRRKARSDFHAKLRASDVGSQRSILEDALPQVFQTRVFAKKIWNELTRHHRWLSLVFHYSEVHPRILRTLALATRILTTIFFIAGTFALGNPEKDEDCAIHTNRDDCLEPLSRYYTGQARCAWSNRDQACTFRDAHLLLRVMLFVVIFSCVLAAPVNMITDYVYKHILAAPIVEEAQIQQNSASSKYAPDGEQPEEATQGPGDAQDSPAGGGSSRGSSGVGPADSRARTKPLFTAATSGEPSNYPNPDPVTAGPAGAGSGGVHQGAFIDKPLKVRAAEALAELEREIRRYRDAHVKGIIERRRFDRMWGLAPSGLFIKPEVIKQSDSLLKWVQVRLVQPDRAFVRRQVLLAIERAQQIEEQEVWDIGRRSCSDEEVGRTLLFLLQCDLLPGLSGRILENKRQRDTERVAPVPVMLKMWAFLFIAVLLGGFLFFVFQFTETQPKPLRTAWFKAFMLYIVLDCVGVSGAHVLVTHYLVPSVGMRKVAAVKEYLVRKLQRLETEVQRRLVKAALKRDMESGGGEVAKPTTDTDAFNAAAYLYASYRLSCYVPTLRESQVVRLCSEPHNTRQQTLKEVMFGLPKAAPRWPRRAAAGGATLDTVNSMEEGLPSKKTTVKPGSSALPRIAGVEVPAGLLALSGALSLLLAWLLYFMRLLVWYGYQIFRPFLMVAVTFPEPLQDLLLDIVAVVTLGCVLLVHIMLYDYSPPLAFLPVFVVGTVTHFHFASGNGAETTRVAGLKYAALQAKAEQRRLIERRFQIEEAKAEQEETSAARSAPVSAAAPALHRGEGEVAPVHSSIKRSSVLRASLQRESAKYVAAMLQRMDSSSMPRSQSGEALSLGDQSNHSSSGGAGKFESRLQHFLSSADKVLQGQKEPVNGRTSPSPHGGAKGGGSFSTASNSPKQQTGVPSLRAVDSFYQARHSATAEPSPFTGPGPGPGSGE